MTSLIKILENLYKEYPRAVAARYKIWDETPQHTIDRVIKDGVTESEESFLIRSEWYVREKLGKHSDRTYKVRWTWSGMWRQTNFSKYHWLLYLNYSPKFLCNSDSWEKI